MREIYQPEVFICGTKPMYIAISFPISVLDEEVILVRWENWQRMHPKRKYRIYLYRGRTAHNHSFFDEKGGLRGLPLSCLGRTSASSGMKSFGGHLW